MNLGVCQCVIDKSGASCKHQFVLWSTRNINFPNFLPVFDCKMRQMLAIIAIGDSLSANYYESLHSTSKADLLDDAAVEVPVDLVQATN